MRMNKFSLAIYAVEQIDLSLILFIFSLYSFVWGFKLICLSYVFVTLFLTMLFSIFPIKILSTIVSLFSRRKIRGERRRFNAKLLHHFSLTPLLRCHCLIQVLFYLMLYFFYLSFVFLSLFFFCFASCSSWPLFALYLSSLPTKYICTYLTHYNSTPGFP